MLRRRPLPDRSTLAGVWSTRWNLVVGRPDLVGRDAVPFGPTDDELRSRMGGGDRDVVAGSGVAQGAVEQVGQHLTEPLGIAPTSVDR